MSPCTRQTAYTPLYNFAVAAISVSALQLTGLWYFEPANLHLVLASSIAQNIGVEMVWMSERMICPFVSAGLTWAPWSIIVIRVLHISWSVWWTYRYDGLYRAYLEDTKCVACFVYATLWSINDSRTYVWNSEKDNFRLQTLFKDGNNYIVLFLPTSLKFPLTQSLRFDLLQFTSWRPRTRTLCANFVAARTRLQILAIVLSHGCVLYDWRHSNFHWWNVI